MSGYLVIDHRFSPGVPEDLARQTGFDPALLREGKLLEADTIQCKHCLGIVVKHRMRVRPRGYCVQCDGHLCDPCEGKRSATGYQHYAGEALSDAILETAVLSGSPQTLLDTPKIFVP